MRSILQEQKKLLQKLKLNDDVTGTERIIVRKDTWDRRSLKIDISNECT